MQNVENKAIDSGVRRRETGGLKERRGFASMSPEKQREIASKGGRAAHMKGTAHEWTSEEARAAAYTIPSYEDQYYSPDFGQATGAAVPLDDYGYSDYR